MNKQSLLELYTQDQRIGIEYPNLRREVLPDIVRLVDISGQEEGTIIYSRLDETSIEQRITEQATYFESLGQGFEWKVYDYDTPVDLRRRLVEYGFELGDPEAIMVLDMARVPETLLAPVTQNVRQIATVAELAAVRQVEEAVWKEDQSEIIAYLTANVETGLDQMSIFAAYVEDVPACCGWIYYPPRSQFASLWGGSTVAAYRGQGLYKAVLSIRVQEAQQRGVKFLTVDASPMSRPILEKHGFEQIATAWACTWQVA